MRRRLFRALLAGIAAFLLGCFALDELDKGAEIMEQHSGASTHKKKEAVAQSAAPAEDQPTPEERLREWWSNARTLGSEEGDTEDPLVSCALRGRTEFVRRSDCLVRGGRPAG